MPCFVTHNVPNAYDLTLSLVVSSCQRYSEAGLSLGKIVKQVKLVFIPYPIVMTISPQILSTPLSPSAYSSCSLLWIYSLFSRGFVLFLLAQSLFDCIIFLLKKCLVASQEEPGNRDDPSFLLESYFPLFPSNVLLQIDHLPCPCYLHTFFHAVPFA